MHVLFVLRFYHRSFNPCLDFKNGLNGKQCYQTAAVSIKIFSSYRILWRIRSKETLRIMYPKYLVLDVIQRIHLHCGSFGSIIRFWILLRKRSIRFWIKNPDLDFIKLTRPLFKYSALGQPLWFYRQQRDRDWFAQLSFYRLFQLTFLSLEIIYFQAFF